MTTAVIIHEWSVPRDETLGSFKTWLTRWLDPRAAARVEATHTDATVALFRHAMAAFDAAGFDDALLARCDERTLFVDLARRPEDLERLVASVLASGALARPFRELRLVGALHRDGVHGLGAATLTPGPRDAAPQLRVELAARPIALAIRPEETPAAFSARVRSFATSDELLEFETRVRAFATDLASDLEHRLERPATTTSSRLQLVRPSLVEVGRFRHLGFERFVRPATYSAEPRVRRKPPRDTLFDAHWYDPYWPLVEWVALEAASQRGEFPTAVTVLRADGSVVSADRAVPADTLASENPAPNSVSIDGRTLRVHESVPRAAGLDPAEHGSAHTPGWGGGS